ncbi:MAG TPA: 2-amino-4-hydroxy-6-hydroxymethyldihydropteridine diphosphokinase [Longimicrobiales bacterium]|nr:2-amino-4-hydroxy-6-hydroxymethyldihydropteridine diphosphokinase [Longimicrobiales bacterium]
MLSDDVRGARPGAGDHSLTAEGGTDVFLSLGSNLGDRMEHLRYAVRRLGDATTILAVSSIYETEPWGYTEQPAFLNMVVRASTRLTPRALLGLAHEIEAERLRVRTHRNAPRTLDVDILLYGKDVIQSPDLRIPHPAMGERLFVLIPLLEIDPEVRDPATGVRYETLLPGLAGAGGVRKVASAEAVQRVT